MSYSEPLKKKAEYYTINDGTFRLPTTETDPEAIRREWKSPDGTKSGVKFEKGFRALFGKITDVSFHKSDFGTNMNITLDENENGINPVISIKSDSRYADSFLKVLPNLDLTQEVRLMPYDFQPTEGPRQVGISVSYRDETGEFTTKVHNFFQEKTGDKWTNLYGYPEATDEDREDWAFFFKKCNKFLIKYAQENVLPKFQKDIETKTPIKSDNRRDDPDAIDKAFDDAFTASKEDSPFN